MNERKKVIGTKSVFFAKKNEKILIFFQKNRIFFVFCNVELLGKDHIRQKTPPRTLLREKGGLLEFCLRFNLIALLRW